VSPRLVDTKRLSVHGPTLHSKTAGRFYGWQRDVDARAGEGEKHICMLTKLLVLFVDTCMLTKLLAQLVSERSSWLKH
jgi:hypothetical protein